MEYLSHRPVIDKDFEEIAAQIIRKTSINDRDNRLLEIAENIYKENLEAIVDDSLDKISTSDYIFTTKDEHENYPSQVGMLVGLSIVLCIGDIHCENLIVHQKQPHLIDLENSLDPKLIDIHANGSKLTIINSL